MTKRKIGFISFRFAGTDGVSLEADKWVKVLEGMGHQCFYMGGELETPEDRSYLAEELHFQHPETRRLYQECFSDKRRTPGITAEIHRRREKMKVLIYDFIRRFDLDLLIPQNALTIPLNVPLGLALTEVIAETGIPAIAHHHDFFWERKRFLHNGVWDYLNACYPPHLPNIQHVVINTSAMNQLALRTGISSVLIPNVMDFESDPPIKDEYNQHIREDLGIGDDELLVLQPTRVVQRKGIEHAIELVKRLDRKAVLVISHASGDEGYEYQQRVKEFAQLLGARTVFVEGLIQDKRGTSPEGKRIYNLHDIYPHSDLITYPSLFEGFGNAFLEALWFKKPLVVNNYTIYSHDIRPKGFEVVLMDNFVSASTVEETRALLDNPAEIERITEKNYQLGLQHYSFKVLRDKLTHLLHNIWGAED